jgi:alpha-methylacyl-CoA racemase
LGLAADEVSGQMHFAAYDEMRKIFSDRFATKMRDEWTGVFAGTDACVTRVLTWAEAAVNEHLRDRSTLICREGVNQAAPAPRSSRTPPSPAPGHHRQTHHSLKSIGQRSEHVWVVHEWSRSGLTSARPSLVAVVTTHGA